MRNRYIHPYETIAISQDGDEIPEAGCGDIKGQVDGVYAEMTESGVPEGWAPGIIRRPVADDTGDPIIAEFSFVQPIGNPILNSR
jgi:hypothetical protein